MEKIYLIEISNERMKKLENFLKVIGFHAPNMRFKSTSCYLIPRKKKLLILDVGIGIKDKLLNYFITNNLLPEDIAIVISHNHIDHVAGVIGIGDFMLEFYPHSKIKLFMSDTSEKYYDWYYNILKKYNSVFDVEVIDEKLEFEFADFNVEFCKTNHCEDKIKSFATKISYDKNSFVYTSDIASVNDKLKKFIKNSNVVMLDSGNPIKRIKTLPGYHGNTKNNVYEVLNSGVTNVYLTHLKGCFDEKDYINSINKDTRNFVNVIGKETYFNIFTGVTTQEYTRRVSALLA